MLTFLYDEVKFIKYSNFYLHGGLEMNILTLIVTLFTNVFFGIGARMATFFGSESYEINLDLIDSSFVGSSPEELEYKEALEYFEQRRQVRKPITVKLRRDLTNPKPFILTEGGNAVYKALKHKGMQRGPINLE